MKLNKLVKIHNYLYDNNYSCSLSYHFNKYCLTIDKYNSYSPIGMILNFDHLKNNISEKFIVPTNNKILATMNFSPFIADSINNNKKLLSYILMLIIIHSIINNDRYEKKLWELVFQYLIKNY